MNLGIICHLFNPEIAEQVIRDLKFLNQFNSSFYINIHCNEDDYQVVANRIIADLKNAKIIRAPHKGRDIGAKLFLIDLMLKLKNEHDYILIIHDKKSPHTEHGERWRKELLKIVSPDHFADAVKIFEKNPEVGIIAAANFIQNEYDESAKTFLSNSKEQIIDQLSKYNIQTNDYNFVSGNMFWIRAKLLNVFFSNKPIWKIREELEPGNATDFYNGTNIHAWERIMSWIATSQGYKIYGI